MKISHPIFALIGLAIVAFSPVAHADILTFDDLPGSVPLTNYHGLTWSNFFSVNTSQYLVQFGPNGYTNGTVSGSEVIFNSFGNPASVSSASSFTLNSFYLTAAWHDGLQVQINAFDSASHLIQSTTTTINSSSPTLFTFNWAGVSSLDFISSGGVQNVNYTSDGTQFVIDDLTVSATPEPSTYALALSLGLFTTAYMRHKRKR